MYHIDSFFVTVYRISTFFPLHVFSLPAFACFLLRTSHIFLFGMNYEIMCSIFPLHLMRFFFCTSLVIFFQGVDAK